MADTMEFNGAEPVAAFEERLQASREAILNATNNALDEQLAKFILPSDRIAFLADFAKFAGFMAAIKAAECMTPAGTPLEKRAALKQWFPIEKAIKAEVPGMLLEFGAEAEAARVQGAGEEA